jgi:DNA polymerase-4/DNA polymerase V
MSKEKAILHMDGDAFFVGVEISKNPKLKGLPVVTGQERGIVSALSYEAKAIGITRGMPIFRVKKSFPKVIVLPGDYQSYVRYSAMMFDIVRRYTDDVEEYSIDECFADLTGLQRSMKMTYKQIAEKIKKEINDEMDLSVSIGLGPTKSLAKVASKWVKPNGLTVIEKDAIKPFLLETPIGKIWGIGPKTAIKLNKKGIVNAGDFVDKDINWMRRNLSKPYETVWKELNGEVVMRLDTKQKTVYSSIQKTRSFHPATNEKAFLLSQFSKNIEEACQKSRHYKLVPKRISIFLKTKDFKFVNATINLSTPTNTPEVLISMIEEEFHKIHKRGVLYRTTGVTLQNLTSVNSLQTDLFGGDPKTNKFEVIHKLIDELETKRGKKLVYLASTHNAIKKKDGGTDNDDLDRNLLFL